SIVPTNNRAIDLGTNASGKLGLTDAELDYVTAGTVSVGNSGGSNGNGGGIIVSSAITHSNNLSLSESAITVNQSITLAANKNLTMTAWTSIASNASVNTNAGSVTLIAK